MVDGPTIFAFLHELPPLGIEVIRSGARNLRGRPGAVMMPVGERIDVTRPQVARRYNALLGGKDHFPADRASADRIRQELPSVDLAARELRRFLQRAVHYLAADRGIRHFLDLGCGLPHAPNVHEIAQAVDPRTRVVYVDSHPLVGAHARALLTGNHAGDVAFVPGDLADIDAILADRTVRRVLDAGRPVAVLLLAVLHFLPDDQLVRRVIRRLGAAVPAGSYLAVSHVTFDPLAPDRAARLRELADGSPDGPFRARTHAEIGALLDGLQLDHPRLVPAVEWYPERAPRPRSTVQEAVSYGAVARFGEMPARPRGGRWNSGFGPQAASSAGPRGRNQRVLPRPASPLDGSPPRRPGRFG